MNAAVGSIPTESIGNLDPEAEDTAGAQLSALAQCFRHWCPGTFASSHQGPSHTYHQKKNGRVCRPDMIFAPLQWASGLVRSFTAADIHAGHTTQDHVAACADFSLALAGFRHAPMPVRRPIKAADIADPALRSQVEAVLASTPRVPWGTSVHAHAAIVTKHLQEGLARLSADRPKRPKHPYISPDTWDLQRQVAHLRRAVHHRQARLRHHSALVCFQVWRDSALTYEQAFLDNKWAKQMRLALHLQIYQLRGLGSVLRADLRRDRNAYVETLAQQLSQGPSHQLYSAYHKLLVHRRKQPYHLEPLPSINKANGNACSSSEETFQRWREHFGNLEAGSETSFLQLAKQACAQSSALRAEQWPHPSVLAEVPSLPSLCRILAATKTNKAPGMDGLPPELCRHFSAALAPVLHPIVLKQVWRGSGRSVTYLGLPAPWRLPDALRQDAA